MTAPGMTASAWAIDAMIASALLMATVLAVRGPVRRLFGPRIGYALWALPLLRLVMPPLPSSWHAATATPIGRVGETLVLVVGTAAPVGHSVIAGRLAGIGPALAALWLVGAAAFLLHHILRHRRFCVRVLAGASTVEIVAGIRVVTSAAAGGPLAFGLWRRYIAFPIDVDNRYDAAERALALAHEIGHHQRGDLLANWVALAVLALHWFDPMAWYAFRAFRADQELANDAGVLTGRSVHERHTYACAIVKAAQGGGIAATCHLHTIADLKGRLTMLTTSPASRRRLASGGAAVGALLVAGLGLTASGSSAAAISAGVQQAVGTQAAPESSNSMAVPVTPAAPDLPGASTSNAVSKVVVVKDGKTTVYDTADVDSHLAAGDRVSIRPLAAHGSRMILKLPDDPSVEIEVQDVPATGSANCGIGDGKPASILHETGRGEKRLLVLCTNRVRRVAASTMATIPGAPADAYAGLNDAEVRKLAGSRMRETLNSALASLVGSRAGLTMSDRIPEVDRRTALLVGRERGRVRPHARGQRPYHSLAKSSCHRSPEVSGRRRK